MASNVFGPRLRQRVTFRFRIASANGGDDDDDGWLADIDFIKRLNLRKRRFWVFEFGKPGMMRAGRRMKKKTQGFWHSFAKLFKLWGVIFQ